MRDSLNILALNTAGVDCDLCLLTTAGEAVRRSERLPRGVDAHLPALVAELLSERGAGLSDIDRIAVVTGPGAFTGLRIGLAFARGLGLALNKPVLGITSLEAAAPLEEPRALVALAARRRPPDRSWWTQLVTRGAGETPPRETDLDALSAISAGAGVPLFSDTPDALSDGLGADVALAAPSAETAARIAARADPAMRPPKAAYVRPPDAAPARSRV